MRIFYPSGQKDLGGKPYGFGTNEVEDCRENYIKMAGLINASCFTVDSGAAKYKIAVSCRAAGRQKRSPGSCRGFYEIRIRLLCFSPAAARFARNRILPCGI
jgi:hypothetical protein